MDVLSDFPLFPGLRYNEIVIYKREVQGFARCAESPRQEGACPDKSRVCVGCCGPESEGLYTAPIYTGMRDLASRVARWRIMISAERRALMYSDVRCYECSVRRIIRLSVPFSGTAVKHGKLPVSFIHP